MRWTTEKPTKAGWYWMKDGSASIVVEVETGTLDGFYIEDVWQAGVKNATPLKKFTHCQWAGPLELPEEG